MDMATIIIMEWTPMMALVMVPGSVMVKLRCRCTRNDIPIRNFPPISIIPETRTPKLADQWTCWIKREVYAHFVRNILAIHMSLCLTVSTQERRTSEDSGGKLDCAL
jgi:hypothetical protein